jgi:hypothetical protein
MGDNILLFGGGVTDQLLREAKGFAICAQKTGTFSFFDPLVRARRILFCAERSDNAPAIVF